MYNYVNLYECAIYHQIKTLINFLCKWKLNHRSFIQLSKTLSIELIETQIMIFVYKEKETIK